MADDRIMGGSLPRGRRAVRSIVAPAIAVVAIVVLGSLGLLAYAAAAVDRMQVDEERALATRAIARAQEDLVKDVLGVTHWDQAYLALGGDKLDADWADVEIGDYLVDGRGHTMTLVLNRRDAPVYAWRGENRIAPADLAGFVRDAAPLVTEVREEESVVDASAKATDAERLGPPITANGVVFWNGRLYLTAASTVEPETPVGPPRRGPGVILISARAIDPAFLSSLDQNLRIHGVHVDPPVPHDHSDAAATIQIVDVNGFVVASLGWPPRRPGLDVLVRAAPALAAGFLALALAGWAFSARIRAIFHEMAANDMTLERAMEELVRARDQAHAANVAKSQFLANMSHEIRTPLNGVLGMAQVMERSPLDPAQRERLNVIRDSGETLLTVLNDILDVSKIEAGRLEIENHAFDLESAVRAASGPFASLAAQKDVAFVVEFDEAARGTWLGDGVRLRQVISNLASNAVKFTSQGEVRVHVTSSGEGLDVAVSDTGIGIQADRIGELFKKFSQVDATINRRFGGTGLGLAICRELVALMGGQLDVVSEAGKGSTFHFHLPLERLSEAESAVDGEAEAASTADVATPAARGMRILAAEDNATNQLILKSLLEPLGAELVLADDGSTALEAFERGRFDVILMDVQMPGMDGLQATTAIRAIEAERGLPATPILALSANVMSHQIAEYRAAGMNGFIAKPINVADLIAALETALQTPPGDSLAA